jgi:hypothetical protein
MYDKKDRFLFFQEHEILFFAQLINCFKLAELNIWQNTAELNPTPAIIKLRRRCKISKYARYLDANHAMRCMA